MTSKNETLQTYTIMTLASVCIAMNVGLGVLVNAVKLPIYLDASGTIAFALLAGSLGHRGFLYAAFVGGASFLITGLLFNPVVIWFIPTQIAIAAFTFYCIRPFLSRFNEKEGSILKKGTLLIPSGILLGVVAGVVSAPIIAMVFGGITGAGASAITALFLKSGATLFESVLASGIASEPLDKTIQLLLGYSLAKATPEKVKKSLA
ncbi:MAG: hypothetical protein AAGI14_05775 [Pseudomonadota bacterium]